MRPIIPGILTAFTLATLFSSCKKLWPCKTYTELTGKHHLVDLAPLSGAPEFLDTLAKYPQLQVYRAIDNSYAYIMHCHVFYDDLIVFTGNYMLSKSKRDSMISSMGSMPDSIAVSKTPTISFSDAISTARETLDFGPSCISYRLGFYDANAGRGGMPKDYKLVWKIEGEGGLPYVVVDAHDGAVRSSDDGIRE